MNKEAKTDWKTPLIVIGAVVVVAIIIWTIVSINNKKVELEPLTDEDFNIINAFWNTYQTKYDYQLNSYVPDETLPPINWVYFCKNCQDDESCKAGNYQYTTQQKEDLICNLWYDGFNENTKNSDISGFVFENGTTIHGMGGKGLDIRQSHEIMICCVSDRGDKTGEICDSITLGAKCSTN